MSHIAEQLMKRAEEIRLSSPEEVAIDLLKQAGFTEADARAAVVQEIMEKEAANHLVAASGVDIESAVALVKAANVNVKDLASFNLEPEVDPTIELLQKAAQYIDSLESELEAKKEELEKTAQEIVESKIEEIKLPDAIEKFASSASLTFEDVNALKSLNPEVLTKVASAMEEPWEMGRGSGYARPKTDPLLEFILAGN